MKHNTFLVKPASSLCNLRCRYCFYDDVSNSRACKNMGLLSHEMAKELIKKPLPPQKMAAASIFCFRAANRPLPDLIFFGSFWKRNAPCSERSPCSTVSRPMESVWTKNGLLFSKRTLFSWESLWTARGRTMICTGWTPLGREHGTR